MKKSGKCPKCQSLDILTNQTRYKQGHRAYLNINLWSTIQVSAFVCMGCGFVEEYLCDEGFSNASKIDKLRKHWKNPYRNQN